MALVPAKNIKRIANVNDFIRPKNKRQKSQTVGKSAVKKHMIIAEQAMASGDWSEATATTFVAVYETQHEEVYGVPPSMTGRERKLAVFAAARLLSREFRDDLGEMANFLRWTWLREREREAYRRTNKIEGQVIGWRLQFSPKLFVDYSIQKARRSTAD